MLTILVLLLIFHPINCFNCKNTLCTEVFQYHNQTSMRAEYALEVVRIIYNSFRQWFFTITFCEFTYFENRILKYTENYGDGYNVMLLSGCPYSNKSIVKPKYTKHGETAYLVTSDELSIEMSEPVIDAFKRTGVFKPRSAVIFVVKSVVKPDSYFYHVLTNHFRILWSRSITNSVLILKTDSLRMYTYNPFLQQVNDITGVKDVSVLLAKQYHNLYGFKLRLSVFRKLYISDHAGPVLCDSNFAKTILEYFNATCEPLPPRDDSTIGDLLENGTATGVTADLMDEYSDFETKSRILKNTYYGYIDTTYPVVQEALCFIVRKAGVQTTFDSMIRLISPYLLALFIFNFILIVAITTVIWNIETRIFKVDYKMETGVTVMNLIKCFLRQTVDFTFIGPIFRTVVLFTIVYALVINCAIDGIITTGITYQRYQADIGSLTDLANSNLTLGIHNRDLNIVNKSFTPEFYQRTKNRIEIVKDRKIKDILDKRMFQYAVLLKISDAQYIARQTKHMENGKPLFYVMGDCPLPCFIVYGLRYGSPYLPRLDHMLKQLTRAGIMQFWSRTKEDNGRRKLFRLETKEKKPLNISSVKELFYGLLIAEVICVFVFILEIFLHK